MSLPEILEATNVDQPERTPNRARAIFDQSSARRA
jgi:hypothetical protein